MSIGYLSVAEVMAIHDERVIKRFGGSYGILNPGALESAVAAPQQTMFAEELYPDLASKAGILFFLLVQNHGFLDGNKRTAVVAMITFLNLNGFDLSVAADDLFQFAIDVATATLNKDQTTEWVRAHLHPLD